MKSILEKLYNGNLYPYSKFQTSIKQFKIKREKVFKSYSIFLDRLPENLKDDFENLIDEQFDLLPFELEQNFIDGFRIGARLMAEIYIEPSESEEFPE